MAKMTMISKLCVFRLSCAVGVLALAGLIPAAARADGFDDMRRTFQTDIPHFFQTDVPHFFQDDIPCAFGGRPTSGTKTSCKSSPNHKAKPVTKKDQPADAGDAAPPVTNAPHDTTPRDTTIDQQQLAPPAAASGSN